VCGYGTLVTLIDQHWIDLEVPIDGTFFSLLGILLSLLLVFRTNTAYDRFWEGRRQWGLLVNYSRNFAVLMDSLLPDNDMENRLFFARTLANFALVLKGHLRTGIILAELEETADGEREALKQQRLVGEGDLITIRSYHQAFLDITGSCERIKNTPIPFSYSFFIKLFITLYLLLMPLVLVETYQYFTILATTFAAYALLGVEMIGDEIEEPFGLDCNDLPLNQISQTIRRNMHEILTGEVLPIPQAQADYQKVN
jgi:putative membrane protein